jgi:erythronate-4-phosphate dehydrogenase
VSFNIIIDDAVAQAQHLFAPLGNPIIIPGCDITNRAQEADALIIRSRTQITEKLLHDNPRIRFIGSTVVGLDHVDLEACQRHNVTFYTAQGCNARSVAEYVISQVVDYAVAHNREFSSLTVAVIGVGHVGKQVEHLATLLGLTVLLNDPFRAEKEANFNNVTLDNCLQQADIITLHTPLTYSGDYPSYHLINRSNINYIRENSLFINAARGGIADEGALLTRPDLTLITDCWHNEPHINTQLLAASKLATPHIAGHALDAKYRGGIMARDALAQWLTVSTLTHPKLSSITVEKSVNMHYKELTAQVQLAQVLQHAYNFTLDDTVLRLAPTAQRGQVFESYRRNYPIRREWTQQHLTTTSLLTQTIDWADALGFIL